ncbi:hypothetical protein N8D56_14950 [Devosia sp. A8/3-2]|nr:hypothetical protein N8D56_14950 [Devosia sp. A8/3-2]
MHLTRRHFLAAATGIVASRAAGRVLAASNVAYVTPNGQGNGTSWDDAANIAALPQLIKMVGPGGIIALLAEGQYEVAEPIEISGANGAEVMIFGSSRNLGPRTARIVGTRRAWNSGKANAAQFGGNTLFVLGQNGSNLRLANLDIRNVGRVLDMSDRRAGNIVIENVAFTNIRDGIYTNDGSAISNVTIRNFSGRGFSKRPSASTAAARIGPSKTASSIAASNMATISLSASNAPIAPMACASSAALPPIASTSAAMKTNTGMAMALPAERGNANILIQNHRSWGNSDGGYDLKSEGTRLINCVSQDNKRNFRIWGGTGRNPIELQGCASIAPRDRGGVGSSHHMWLRGAEGDSRDAASVVWRNGVLSGGSTDIAIYAEGGNVAVHLVDTDTSRLPKSMKLFSATADSSKILVGSAADNGVDLVLTESPIIAVAGAHSAIPLKADGDVSRRLAEQKGDLGLDLDGATLSLDVPDGSSGGLVLLQARDSRGVPVEKELTVRVKENPLGAGAVLASAFAPAAATNAVTDAVGLNQPVLNGKASFRDGGLRFSGNDAYVEIPASANFHLDGPFAIHLRFSLDASNGTGELDVMSNWQLSSNERFRVPCGSGKRLNFARSTDGRAHDGNFIMGPQLAYERIYDVIASKAADGHIELIIDGVMAGRSPEPVEALHASPVPLRVSGRANGDATGIGTLYALEIYKGRSDLPPPTS